MTTIYGKRIREIRQAAGLTQTEFARRIGTTKNQLSKYELGIQDTPTKIIISVCEQFNANANWLLGIEEDIKYLHEIHEISNLILDIDQKRVETLKAIKSKGLVNESELSEQVLNINIQKKGGSE